MKRINCFKIFQLLIFSFLLLVSFSFKENDDYINTNNEYVDKVLIGGDSIGLSIGSHVEIIGFNTEEDGLKKGDIIVSINNQEIKSVNDISKVIMSCNEENVIIKVLRNNKYELFTRKISFDEANNKKSLGLFVRDKILGIGTLSFVNLNTQRYAALAHGVDNAYDQGAIYTSRVQNIKKATSGVAGEKIAMINDQEIGDIDINNDVGIFGKYSNIKEGEIVSIAKAKNIKLGKAKILTVVKGEVKEYFDIEITDINTNTKDNIKGIKFKVCDKELIDISGGVICGMSGSPIIQDGVLIGAVSHVSVNNPLIGYACIAEYMYKYTL